MSPAIAAAPPLPPAAPPAGWLPRAGKVLVVLARPGQESADLGGLLYAFRRAGADLALLCLSRGEASPLNSTGYARLEAIRPWELRRRRRGVLRAGASGRQGGGTECAGQRP